MSAGHDEALSRREVLGFLAAIGAGAPNGAAPRARGGPRLGPDPIARSAGEVFPPKTVEYFRTIATRLEGMKPLEIASRVKELGRSDEEWRRRKCLSLRAAEGIMGAGAQRVLNSSTATRVSEGFPGAKGGSGKGTDRYIDEIEATIVHLARKLFHAEYVEWRPVSNSMANALPLLTLTEPGDTILAQAMGPGGGNAAYHEHGPGGLKPLKFVDLPYRDHYEVDLRAVAAVARRVRPKLIFIGGSFVLFPYPVRELRQIADEVGATLVYDAAHLALFIAGGILQQPLDEGAHILTMSTHKSFGGPVGGVTLTNDPDLATKMIHRTLNGFVQTRDANKLVAAGYTFAEVAEFGAGHAAQTLKNAQAFGAALDRDQKFKVLARERNYTRTHQVIVDVREFGVRTVIDRCVDCNILVQGARLLGDTTEASGLRLSVAELTRLGMKEEQMGPVAAFIRRAVDGRDVARLPGEIETFLGPFQTVRFAFDV